MFGDHKKHDILSLKEGEAFLRGEIDKKIRAGSKNLFSIIYLIYLII